MKDSQHQLSELQIRILEIFKIIRKIIEENNLHYIAIGGTALGAVRHEGFIPWDDDIDIALPREDYNKLLELLKSELPQNLELRTYKDSENYCFKFSKVIDFTTTIIENDLKSKPDLDEGVFVDIMPFDGLPRNGKYKYHMGILSMLNKLDRYICLPIEACKKKKSKMLYKVISPLKPIMPIKAIGNAYFKIATKYSVYNTDFFGCKWAYPTFRNIILKKDMIENTVDLPFEDTTIKVPRDYDEFLKIYFGEYMTLPPKEKQISHHGFIVVDFEIPYREYRKKYDLHFEEGK